MSERKHVLSVTVRDRPGVLVRIAALFARRGYNIESLSVAQTHEAGMSRTTFVVSGEDDQIEQMQKQLQKLIDVIKVIDHSEGPYVDRELMLIKVAVRTPDDRVEMRQIAQDFRARIVDVARDALVFEVTGDEPKTDAFIEQMRAYGVLELIRTGRVALPRSATRVGADVRGADDRTPAKPRAA
ncbi:MAG: acetolactate synthase small subunit [bacterium]|nr:acetolactate synthase small subunit [bacterium]